VEGALTFLSIVRLAVASAAEFEILAHRANVNSSTPVEAAETKAVTRFDDMTKTMTGPSSDSDRDTDTNKETNTYADTDTDTDTIDRARTRDERRCGPSMHANMIARKPLSLEHEILAMNAVKYITDAALDKYPTSLSEDIQVYSEESIHNPMSVNKRNAMVCRMGEKKVLHHYYSMACEAIELLNSCKIDFSSGRMSKNQQSMLERDNTAVSECFARYEVELDLLLNMGHTKSMV